MKKIILACTLFIMLSMLSSCVKSFTCACVYNDGNEEVTTTTEYTTAKSAAEESCSEVETELKNLYPDAECSLN